MAQRTQQQPPDNGADMARTLQERDTVPLVKGIAVGYDIAGTIMRMAGDYGQYEANVKVNLRDRYFPTAEIGLGTAKHSTDAVTGISLETSAPYFRIGADINISKNKHDDYRVFIGARYAFTSFKQKIHGTVDVPYWGGTIDYAMSEESCSRHWVEVLFGIDAKLFGPVRLGWTFRYKNKISEKTNEGEELWYVPGYGKAGHKLGGTFNISIELARKNKKVSRL